MFGNINHGGSCFKGFGKNICTTVVYHPGMAREDPQLKLRLSAELKARIEEAAKTGSRTMNSEIISRLEDSFRGASLSTGGLLSPQHLLDVVEAQRQTIKAQEVNLIMLSTYLVDVINVLPTKLRNEERIKAAAQFVLGMDDRSAGNGQQTMLELDSPRTVETVKAVVRGKAVDTGIVARVPAGAAKKR